MLQQQLGAESRGDAPRTFASTRTLFGIRSAVEQQLDEFVAREEARKAQQRKWAHDDVRSDAAAGEEEEHGDRSHRAD